MKNKLFLREGPDHSSQVKYRNIISWIYDIKFVNTDICFYYFI